MYDDDDDDNDDEDNNNNNRLAEEGPRHNIWHAYTFNNFLYNIVLINLTVKLLIHIMLIICVKFKKKKIDISKNVIRSFFFYIHLRSIYYINLDVYKKYIK